MNNFLRSGPTGQGWIPMHPHGQFCPKCAVAWLLLALVAIWAYKRYVK